MQACRCAWCTCIKENNQNCHYFHNFEHFSFKLEIQMHFNVASNIISMKARACMWTWLWLAETMFVIIFKVLDALLRNFVYKLLWLYVILWSISKNHNFTCMHVGCDLIGWKFKMIVTFVSFKETNWNLECRQIYQSSTLWHYQIIHQHVHVRAFRSDWLIKRF